VRIDRRHDRAGAVDVSLHDVSAERLAGAQRTLEIQVVAGWTRPSQVRAKVSRLRWNVATPSRCSTTVQQTPDSAIESPIGGRQPREPTCSRSSWPTSTRETPSLRLHEAREHDPSLRGREDSRAGLTALGHKPSLLTLSSRQGTVRCAILTLFPEAIRPYLDESILGIAQAQGNLRVDLVDFRNYAYDPHRTVDDRPFGGGPGMVLKPEPIFDAVSDVERAHGRTTKSCSARAVGAFTSEGHAS
jgi:hypothetical protein